MEILQYLPELISAILGGGIVTLFMLPEKKASARLDNAERVVKKYEDILQRYEKRISELEQQVKQLQQENDAKDKRIDELEQLVVSLKQRRNSKGQFLKA